MANERKKSNSVRRTRRIRRRRVFTRSNALAALVCFLFIFCSSVVLTLNLRQIYYFDIKYQNLASVSGLSEEAIRENYDALIDYNLLTKGISTLEFPDFTMSEQGRTHFAEVKRIFIVFQIMSVILGILLAAVLFIKFRRRDFGCLKIASILTLAISAVLALLMAGDWNVFFVRFHQLLFSDSYWIFDPATDPVINILPDVFFLHCAAAILLFMLAGCVLCALLYRFLASGKKQIVRRDRI